jgi:triosephosphate isomerase
VLTRQLAALLDAASSASGKQTIIAYEPIWAIGSGAAASIEQVEAAHAHIRTSWSEQGGADVDALRVVYGGSVNAANAADFAATDEVDGLLVGGASLKADEFHALCSAFAIVRLK